MMSTDCQRPDMAAGITRLFRLFVSSYAPLAVILAIQRSEDVWPPGGRPAFWILLPLVCSDSNRCYLGCEYKNP